MQHLGQGMTSPQTEDGYTRIANELLDAILRYPFSKRELNIVLAVVRKTYGYNKKSDDMTLTQLAELASIDLAHVSRTVAALVEKNVLLKQQGRYGYIIGINKKYNTWAPCQNGNLAKTASEPCQNSNISLPKEQEELAESANTKDNSKRQSQKTTPKGRDTAPGLNAAAWDEYEAYRRQGKLRQLKPASVDKQQRWLVEQGPPDVQQRIIDQTIRNNWQGLFELKGNGNGTNQQDSRSRAQRVNDRLREIAEREPAAALGGGLVCETPGALSAQVDFGD